MTREQRQKLWNDLRTRIITDEELATVLEFGSSLAIPDSRSYRDSEIETRFDRALLHQAILRSLSKQ